MGVAKAFESADRGAAFLDERAAETGSTCASFPNEYQVGQVVPPSSPEVPRIVLSDFYAYLPSHSYLYKPTRETWPASSVNNSVMWPKDSTGKDIAPASWLDKHRHIEQMVWDPSSEELVRDKLLDVGGWLKHPGASVFNLYRHPEEIAGDPTKAQRWVDHVEYVYPDDAAHLIRWLAHRVQFPGIKCNHAIVLGGEQGIGKDTLLEPVKAAVGSWNWQEISPAQMLGRFNGWAKAVIVRMNEARDLGDHDRFAMYDHSKVYIAAPPDVLRVDEKHLREHAVANVLGLIITSNHKSDGIYLPADDRRHYVAWSPRARDEFTPNYWTDFYRWLSAGGTGHVCAYLRSLDLSGFDPKAPPLKTPAFWSVVAAGEAPESGELRDMVEDMGNPPTLTLTRLIAQAERMSLCGFADELRDRKSRRSIPFKLERIGFVPVRNPDSQDGLFKIDGRRQSVYALKTLSLADQVRAARSL